LGWLDRSTRRTLEIATPLALRYTLLVKRYRHIDFRPACGYWIDWENKTQLDLHRKDMISACFLHFLCDTATVFCYLGSAYVSAHRPTKTILHNLKPILDPALFHDLTRIFNYGAPKLCNASATDANFWTALRYGNHKSTDEDPEKTRRSIIKDCRRGFALSLDMRLLLYVPHAHCTPLGMVDLNKRFKKPRPVFDSTFRPVASSFAINDWTNKTTEPPVQFARSFLRCLIWIWNLRITYPDIEIYPI
jgi:hypothetical protein